MSFEIIDLPSANDAKRNYIYLNRLLGNNNDSFVKRLILVDQLIQCHSPVVCQVKYTSLKPSKRKEPIKEKESSHQDHREEFQANKTGIKLQ